MQLKIRKIVLFVFIICSTLEILLIRRYIEMGILKDIIGFSLVVLFGVFFLSYSFQKWEDMINPISLYFIFIFGFGYSLLEISKLVKPYDSLSLIILLLSIVSYITGASSNIKFQSPFKFAQFTQSSNLLIYYLTLGVSILSFILEIKNIGYLPIIRMFSFDVYNDTNTKLVSFIHYFVMLFAIFPAWTYILFKKKILCKKMVIIIMIISFFSVLNYLSRQTILLLMLSFLLSYTFYNKVKIRKLIFYATCIIGFFFLVGQIRMVQMDSIKKSSDYTANDFLRNVTGIKYKTNLVESTYTLYSSIRYSTFIEYVSKATNDEYVGLGKYTFRPLISLAFLDRIGLVEYEPDFNVNAALATYAIDPFLDFGILGVIFFGFIIGLISKHFYEYYKSGKENYIISWALIVFCLIMAPFMNFFSSFFIFLVWGLNKLIIT